MRHLRMIGLRLDKMKECLPDIQMTEPDKHLDQLAETNKGLRSDLSCKVQNQFQDIKSIQFDKSRFYVLL